MGRSLGCFSLEQSYLALALKEGMIGGGTEIHVNNAINDISCFISNANRSVLTYSLIRNADSLLDSIHNVLNYFLKRFLFPLRNGYQYPPVKEVGANYHYLFPAVTSLNSVVMLLRCCVFAKIVDHFFSSFLMFDPIIIIPYIDNICKFMLICHIIISYIFSIFSYYNYP